MSCLPNKKRTNDATHAHRHFTCLQEMFETYDCESIVSNLKEKLNALRQVREKASTYWIVDFANGRRQVSETTVSHDMDFFGPSDYSKPLKPVRIIEVSPVANEWTSLIEALEIAVETLEYHTQFQGLSGPSDKALIKIDALLS